jgi:hypothetical protein
MRGGGGGVDLLAAAGRLRLIYKIVWLFPE